MAMKKPAIIVKSLVAIFLLLSLVGLYYFVYTLGFNHGARAEEAINDRKPKDCTGCFSPTPKPPYKPPGNYIDFEPPSHPNWTEDE